MNKMFLVLFAATTFALAGCSTVNPYTGEKQTSNATKGAIIGGLAGAAVGLATGKDAKSRRQYATVGLGAGAATGAGVGYYMDVQEAKLREQLQSTGVQVIRDGDNIILSMPGNITFASDSTALSTQAKEALSSVSLVLKEYKKTSIVVAGYTDSTGQASYNQLLSQQRAQSVANELLNSKVENSRLHIQGFGATNFIASNDTTEGRAQNRRVELTLVPTAE